MYGLVALGYHMTWATSRTMNFSQGHVVMVGAVVAYALHVAAGWPLALAAAVALAACGAAGLTAIHVPRAGAVSYALSSGLAGVAGLLLAPLLNVSPTMGTLIGLKAFAVAILGGLTSAAGIVVAGLLYGLVEALVAGYVSTGAREIVGFAVVIAMLVVRPWGPGGPRPARRG